MLRAVEAHRQEIPIRLPCDGCKLAPMYVIRPQLRDALPTRLYGGLQRTELCIVCSSFEWADSAVPVLRPVVVGG